MSKAKSASKMYAVGVAQTDRPHEFGMIAGPTDSLQDMLDFWPTDFDKNEAYIIEYDDSVKPVVSKNIFRFNHRRKEWERTDRQDEFVDPLLGHKYEMVLRSRQELIESLGYKELRLQDRFFGEKPDLNSDEQAQFACVYHHGQLMWLYYDRLRFTDDEKLRRDLAWVKHAAEYAYKMGYFDGLAGKLSKPEDAVPGKPKPVQSELPLGGVASRTIKRVK